MKSTIVPNVLNVLEKNSPRGKNVFGAAYAAARAKHAATFFPECLFFSRTLGTLC
jgi:hypothetical protein